MRVVLFTGKGGVGKTTVAAATAVRAARSGVRTLVVSTDAAHSLGDCLGRTLLSDEPCELEPGLVALQVDAAARLHRSWGDVQGYLVDVLVRLGVPPVDAAELSGLPGADDVMTLLAVREQVAAGPWDLVVVDCAPTAETLRLLAVPEALGRLVDRLLPAQLGLARAVAPVLGRAADLPRPAAEVGAALLRLRADLAQVLELLRAPTTSVQLVLTPQAVVLAETRRTLTALALQGFAVEAAVANRVIPADDGSAWQRSWGAAQDEVLEQAREQLAPVPVRPAPYLAAEPVGPDALAALADHVLGEAGVAGLLDVPGRTSTLRVESVPDGGFDLVLDLPDVTAADVDLARVEDDLVIEVAGHRRMLPLPAALRRCTVESARVRQGALRVRFVPDPDRWPERSQRWSASAASPS